MKKTGILFMVMTISLLIVMPTSAATVWDLNTDLAAVPGWPGGSPATGNWSMGWTKNLWQNNLFVTYLDGPDYVWHTDLTAAREPYKSGGGGSPDGSTTPHGGFQAATQKCFLAPSNYVDPNDSSIYSVYTLLMWKSPVDIPELTAFGTFHAPANGGKVNAYVARLDDPNTIDPNVPLESLDMLYLYLDDEGPSTKTFRVFTSVQANNLLLFAIKRNNTENGDNNGLSLIDISITDEWTEESCLQQGIYNNADINKDCYVNLEDLTLLIRDWLDCNDPQNQDCPVVP